MSCRDVVPRIERISSSVRRRWVSLPVRRSEDLTRLLAAEQDASARLRSRLAAAEDQLTHRRSNDPGQDRMDKLLRSER